MTDGSRRLAGRVVVVTGAAQGLGECVARTLAGEGATLVLADVQEEKAAAVVAELRSAGADAESAYVDVAERRLARELVAHTVARHGAVDGLVLCGGIDAPPGLAWELDEQQWRSVVDVDLTGQWWCAEAVLPHMLERRTGRIVFIGSVVARIGNARFSPAYAAAKAGLVGLTVQLSAQVERYGVLVNCIAPGALGTGTPVLDEERVAYDAQFPLGIVGPQPVADAVVYLLAASGDWISGAVLNVSGGRVRGV